ncbi:MAG TPA: cation:proton antiporter [Solimonas sp.]|nr:cation:proton antiporter [Solimonas sp.]
MRRSVLSYLALLALSLAGLAALLMLGSHWYPAAAVAATPVAGEGVHPLTRLLLQIVVVVAAARLVGLLARRLGQPAVIGEILAGILLGPSLLGSVSPAALAFLFPASSLPPLQLLSQIGVLLFMFLVGLEVDLSELRRKARSALLISHSSIVLPFLLGLGLALGTYPLFAPPGISFQAFGLFMGIAMSITAFPVLARILEERGMLHTPLGRSAIACAAIDDVTAWCLLALVIALVQAGSLAEASLGIVLACAYTAFMLRGLRPLLARWAEQRTARGDEALGLSVALGLLFASAATTEAIGIHALFGAFLAGAVMPVHGPFRAAVRERLHGFATLILLPLFFALTGLRTELGLLTSPTDLLLALLIIAVAVAGKLGGGLLAARLTGSSWREAFMIGTLMNTRGLMELVVLNIGYDLGILSPRVFSLMVVMALVTTLMTGPLLDWAQRRGTRAPAGSPTVG